MEREDEVSMKRKWWIYPIIAVVVVAVAFFGFRFYQSKKASTVQAAAPTYTVRTGNLTATVSAFGNARSQQTALLNWQTSGTVASVNVQIGDQVKAGQVMATLDPTTLSTTILTAQSNLVTDQQALDTLLNSKVSEAQAQVNLATAATNLQNAQTAASGLAYPRGSQNTITTAQNNYTIDQGQVALAQDNFDKVKNLAHDDPRYIQALSTLTSATSREQTDLATLNYLTGKPDQNTINTDQANLALAQAQYNDALSAWNQAKNGPTQAQIQAAQAKIQADESTIAEGEVTAPFSGTVTAVNVLPGDVVAVGAQAFEVDDLSTIYVDMQVSELSIDQIKVGQPVQLTFDAIANKTYDGQITQVGAVGTNSSGVVNYTVTAKVTNPDAQVRSGMTASVNIVTSQISNVLLVPTSSIQTFGNNHLVFLQGSNGQPTPVRITIGQSSNNLTQVVSGNLKAGDVILLTPPGTTSAGSGAGGLRIFGGGFGGGGGNFNRGGTGGGARPSGGAGGAGGG
jgi:HlyD family secretion protein